MKINGLNRTGLDFALALGNAKYAGNVKWAYEPKQRGRAWLVRLTSQDNEQPGVKLYAISPVHTRKGPAVCWHAHRDFLRAVFDLNPAARIKTAFATYNSQEHFEQTFRATQQPEDRCSCEE